MRTTKDDGVAVLEDVVCMRTRLRPHDAPNLDLLGYHWRRRVLLVATRVPSDGHQYSCLLRDKSVQVQGRLLCGDGRIDRPTIKVCEGEVQPYVVCLFSRYLIDGAGGYTSLASCLESIQELSIENS